MKNYINLRKPIMINGKEVSKLSYDLEKVTIDDYLKALNLAVTKSGGITGTNIKLDSGAQLCIGMYAVLADNPEYDITDLDRITGFDVMEFANIGLNFIAGREVLTQEVSDQPSATTESITAQTQQGSKSKE